jgi:diguanylate cyclase (GGDEF)-like protein/PAS domain S-box-containing protein
MAISDNVLSIILFTIGFFCLFVALLIWQKRQVSDVVKPLFLLLIALSWWDLTYAIFWTGLPGPTPYFWLDITYIGVLLVPSAFLAFSIHLSEFQHWLKPSFFAALAIEPVLIFILMWTDPWHNLFFGGNRVLNSSVILEAGPIFWANIIYTNLLIVVGTVLLIYKFISSSGIFRKQIGIILIGVAIPWISSLILVFGLNPLPNADNTPFSFSVAALAFAYAVFQFRFLEVVPIARDTVVENMQDGVFVLDHQNRLLDLNQAAKKLIGLNTPVKLGESITKFLEKQPEIFKSFLNVDEVHQEIQIDGPVPLFLDLQISPLFNQRNFFVGRLIVLRDITKLKQTQFELHQLAITDSLTHIYNRRHFMELAEKELYRATRYAHKFSIILMDIDYFKQINDTHGHESGDRVLISFADFFMQNIREHDIFARFGGDEFILLLPQTSGEEASVFLERLQNNILISPVVLENVKIFISFTAGITEFIQDQDTIETMIKRADQYLYRAKEGGRKGFKVG